MTSSTLIDAPSLLEPVGEGRTLDDLLVALWEGLGGDGAVECPVCEGEMQPVYGVHARAIGGRCTSCGTTVQ